MAKKTKKEAQAEAVSPPSIGRRKKFQCDQCEKSFKTEGGLRMHALRAHSGRHWGPGKKGKIRIAKALRAVALSRRKKHRRHKLSPEGRANIAAAQHRRRLTEDHVSSINSRRAELLHFNFCPQCSCPVGDVKRALDVVNKVQKTVAESVA